MVAPAAALQRGPEGSLAYVVRPDQTVEARAVRVELQQGPDAVIGLGLEADSEWFALDTLDLRRSARPALSLLGEVAHRPLATYNADGALRASVVENQAFLRLGGSLERRRFELRFPR